MFNKQKLEIVCWVLLGLLIILGIPLIKWEQRRTHQAEFERKVLPRSINYCIYECMAARNTESNCNNWCRRD